MGVYVCGCVCVRVWVCGCVWEQETADGVRTCALSMGAVDAAAAVVRVCVCVWVCMFVCVCMRVCVCVRK